MVTPGAAFWRREGMDASARRAQIERRSCGFSSIAISGVALLSSWLVGCISYQPKPLDSHPQLATDAKALSVVASEMPLPELAAHRFDPSDGLDMTEVAMLAVANNPDLKVARDQLGVTRAQAFAAGLLPNPVLNLSAAFPTGAPGAVTAYGAGVSMAINALLTRSATTRAARLDATAADLALLWQEWQVVTQARLLFVKILSDTRRARVLEQQRDLFFNRYSAVEHAVQRGNATADSAATDLAALQDIERQLNDVARSLSGARHDLNDLLGLASEAKLELTGEPPSGELDDAAIRAYLPDIAKRRPDLLALQTGYQSQEQRLRKAVLAQFPALDIGINWARDNTGVPSVGPTVTIALPLFDRNQGNIAIEKATRQRLYDEYEIRVTRSVSQVERLLADQRLLTRQLDLVDQGLRQLEMTDKAAEAALNAGTIDVLTYANLHSVLLSKRVEKIGLEESIFNQRIALLTNIGGELPLNARGR